MLPAPFSVHAMVPLLDDAPLTVAVALEQIVWLPPAEAVGTPLIVIVLEEETLEHGALPVAVSVSVTVLPERISAALGVYVANVSESSFEIVPDPLEVHNTLM